MGIHPDFPASPYAILKPEVRWFPADEHLRSAADRMMPPLVSQLRKQVATWRSSGYAGAAPTSRALLHWWFDTEHHMPANDGTTHEFRYFFAQREALETIIYLHDVIKVSDALDLFRFDATGELRRSLFPEDWRRYVIKMATGSGKTKVLSLVLAWSFFHKTYEPESDLSRNFLVITPNIIVLDRIRRDFEGLRIFLRDDPVLPDDGYEGQDWRSDFQLDVHIQDDVHVTHPTGNIFLTNIHRVFTGNEAVPSVDDDDLREYFLGPKAVAKTNDSSVDLGVIIRDVDELMVLNDEAHHIHDERLAWYKSIEDIHNRLKQKGSGLSMQVDTTATPKHTGGAIFAQTVADYPLVEAIEQGVVKKPVLPDFASRSKLKEYQSSNFTEKYQEYIDLGVIEWRQAAKEHEKVGKKAVLFIMTDDTRNCDEVAEFLETHHPDLQGAVLVIHTKQNGEVSEASSGKGKEELDLLRQQANQIDGWDSPYKAVISVMMLKEGWDVRNVTTIVGLRAYAAASNILPEQTLGRGLRRMYANGIPEELSVCGTNAFMDFVESITAEGIKLDYKPMGPTEKPIAPIVVEVDKENTKKDLDALDISIPVLTPRTYREYKNLADLDPANMPHEKIKYRQFTPEEQREIVFKDVTHGEISHVTTLDAAFSGDYRAVIGFFASAIQREMRLVASHAILYPKVEEFVAKHLFDKEIELDSPNTLRNLSEIDATNTIIQTFKKAINDLTVRDRGDTRVQAHIKLRDTRPFMPTAQEYMPATKSVFNRIVGDSHFELLFADFLEKAPDVVKYAKNYLAVHFKIDYVNADGDPRDYYPDFLVVLKDGRCFVVETKGEEDLDDPLKVKRLRQWCEDVNREQTAQRWDFVYVDQASFERYHPIDFKSLEAGFRQFKDA